MGRGDRATVRWKKGRQKRKKERGKRKAKDKGKVRKG